MASSATPAKVDDQEKVMAAAQQIVSSLAPNRGAADDMMRILCKFDSRLSDLLPTAAVDPDEIESRLAESETVILQFDSSDLDCLLLESPPSEIARYFCAIDDILSLSGHLESDQLSRAESLVQIAMSRLGEEFRHLMIRSTVPFEPRRLYSSISHLSLSIASDGGETAEDSDASTEEDQQEDRRGNVGRSALLEDWNVDLIHPEAVADLKEIADRMIRADYGMELCQVHCSIRREILDECLALLGVEKMGIEEVQRLEWSALNDKMKKWIQALKVVIRVLLVEERRLCDQIFEESDQIREECFTESAKGCVMHLLSFGDAITIGRRSSEKLFGILDMCEALTDVLPDLDALFSPDFSQFICGEAKVIVSRLGNAVKGTLAEFGKAVQREPEPPRKALQGCEIHPLTRYVMNYLKLLVVYNSSLDVFLEDDGANVEECAEDARSMTRTGRRLFLLMTYLESNLEEKSKLYEDAGMQYVFLMNNLLYMVQKVRDSELRTFLGDDWIRKRSGRIRQYSMSYLRSSWTRVLSYLKDDGLSGTTISSGSRAALKEKFKNFNLAFEELHRTQATWKIPDDQLREELRLSISEKIIPAYRCFMGRFGSQLEGARHAAKYIKYNLEDLEKYVSDLFEGLPGASSNPRRKLSS